MAGKKGSIRFPRRLNEMTDNKLELDEAQRAANYEAIKSSVKSDVGGEIAADAGGCAGDQRRRARFRHEASLFWRIRISPRPLAALNGARSQHAWSSVGDALPLPLVSSPAGSSFPSRPS